MKLTEESVTGILDFLPYPFLIAITENETVHVKFCNKKFNEEIGYAIEEINTIDKWFNKAYPDLKYRAEIKSKWMAGVDEAIREKRDYVMERAHITTKHHGQKWYEVKSSINGDIQFVAFVNINDDIEKDERLERLNENKNRVLSILGHDLKSPIQNLAKLVQLLIDGGLSQSEFQSNLKTVQRLSADTLQFIDTTLTWTRNNFEGHQPDLRKFSLRKLVDSVLDLYSKECELKSISPIVNIPDTTDLFSDREIIHIGLRNIVSNAIKFSPSKTPIIIGYRNNRHHDYITVSDQGEGIPPEIIDRIMHNKSNKSSGSGFGMGLKLCKELLQHVNGTLEITSTVGKGTSISIVIRNTPN